MYRKPLIHLSERQKRNLRQQIKTGILNLTSVKSPIPKTQDLIAGTSKTCSSISNPDVADSIDNIFVNTTLVDSSFGTTSPEISSEESDEEQTKCLCGDCRASMSTELISNLNDWVLECNIALIHVTKLLKILKNHNLNVPGDARTLLSTPRNLEVMNLDPGSYYHMNLKESVLKDLNSLPKDVDIPLTLKLNVNVDGLPLTKSSGSQFWPILGWLEPNTFKEIKMVPFVIGIYHGFHKPKSSNDFLKMFVDEYNFIKESGIDWNGKTIKIELNAFICDTPARAFITQTKGHNGYHGCGKCTQEGDFLNNRMTFCQLGYPLRTNKSFREKEDEDHHLGTSILEKLDIDMVSQIPLDYMHLVCLGIMKRLLQFWHKGKQDMNFAVVKFLNNDGDEELFSEVPSNWLTKNNSHCYWPPKHHTLYISKMFPPQEDWDEYEVEVECFCETYAEAKQKAEGTQNTQNESLEGRGCRIPKPRDYFSPAEEEMRAKKLKGKKTISEDNINFNSFLKNLNEESQEIIENHETAPQIIYIEDKDSDILREFKMTNPTQENTIDEGLPKNLFENNEKKIDKIINLLAEIKLDIVEIKERMDVSFPQKEEEIEISLSFPLKNLTELESFEEQLKTDKSILKSYQKFIKTIGGHDHKDFVSRFCKKLLTNSLAECCSWLGRKNNYAVGNLEITNQAFGIIHQKTKCTRKDYETTFAEWLRHAKQRRLREETKNN
ncbi:unnamed protein product [Brassicogethes aeneus]|uniref:DUF4806 domain-containing protein n=1 Tax=Brassicogethes aeneus TaxID=1431903 RepID=A0A9P0FDQ5_BRAAE|nr:unnamed protein product [Brassicogethes aeneus]